MEDSVKIKSEEDVLAHKPIMLFGRDITEIPCFRTSLICGICTGVAGGLVTFLVTSKTLFSTHMAFGITWVGVFAYWIPCRYKLESGQLLMEKARRENRRKFRESFNEES